jgi:hypothetical protein
MHTNLLTDNERTLIKRYLETGERLEGFKVMLHRARQTKFQKKPALEDAELIEALLKKAGEKP